MKKRGKKKIVDWQKLAHKEKILIVILAVIIVFLAFYIGYDVYNSFKTKDETSYLNSAVVLLSHEKSELLSQIQELNH
jgi:cell division protein FtsL